MQACVCRLEDKCRADSLGKHNDTEGDVPVQLVETEVRSALLVTAIISDSCAHWRAGQESGGGRRSLGAGLLHCDILPWRQLLTILLLLYGAKMHEIAA